MAQTIKVKTKKKGLQCKNVHKFWFSSQKSSNCARNVRWRPKKKTGLRTKVYAMFHEIRYWVHAKIIKKQFLLTNSRAISTILQVSGLYLHSSSPKPINFFGAQSSLGGAQAVIWGARPRNAPPWHRAWFGIPYQCLPFANLFSYDVTKRLSHGYCPIGPMENTMCAVHPIPWDISHRIPKVFPFPCTSLGIPFAMDLSLWDWYTSITDYSVECRKNLVLT